jgi:Uncharacterized conserved protein (COG2071).
VIDRVRGTIRRRILVNYRVAPEVIERLLPTGFRPKLVGGYAMAGVCLIRLEGQRPSWFPRVVGVSSENVAHRIAVIRRETGTERESVYIPRRDSASRLQHWLGGRAFPGELGSATFAAHDDGDSIVISMRAADGLQVEFRARDGDSLPRGSVFASLDDASRFFRAGSLGYSATRRSTRLDAVYLDAVDWQVSALDVELARSTYFDDRARFPIGSVEFDSALIMRNIEHEWRRSKPLRISA